MSLCHNCIYVQFGEARETGKPIVLEDLDLRGKKSGRSLETNRKVSAMAYARLSAQVHARALDCGVVVLSVNPAYSSVQGQLKAVSLGLSVHGGAAYALARRGHGYSERLPKASSLHRLDAREYLTGTCSAPARDA